MPLTPVPLGFRPEPVPERGNDSLSWVILVRTASGNPHLDL